jgi:hypothetical protein
MCAISMRSATTAKSSGRGQHDALDKLWMESAPNIGWILITAISAYFDTIDHEWMLRFLEHRIADKRILRLVKKWLKAGVIGFQHEEEAKQFLEAKRERLHVRMRAFDFHRSLQSCPSAT